MDADDPGATAGSGAGGVHLCDRCGERMYESHCKIICPRCGMTRDCSDP
jgi:exosome complex RNA-binding protein Csl4